MRNVRGHRALRDPLVNPALQDRPNVFALDVLDMANLVSTSIEIDQYLGHDKPPIFSGLPAHRLLAGRPDRPVPQQQRAQFAQQS